MPNCFLRSVGDSRLVNDRETSLTIHLFRLTAFDNERRTIWSHIFHSICKKTQLIVAMLDESKIPKLAHDKDKMIRVSDKNMVQSDESDYGFAINISAGKTLGKQVSCITLFLCRGKQYKSSSVLGCSKIQMLETSFHNRKHNHNHN